MATKICATCLREKDISEYYQKVSDDKVFFHTSCKGCEKAKQKQRRKDDPQPYRNRERKNRLRPEKRFADAKKQAEKRGLSWTLSFDEFCELIKLDCYYCSFKLGKPNTTGSGLDRLDNDKGYEIDNVVPCCGVCNTIRNSHLSTEEMKLVAQTLINYRNQGAGPNE